MVADFEKFNSPERVGLTFSQTHDSEGTRVDFDKDIPIPVDKTYLNTSRGSPVTPKIRDGSGSVGSGERFGFRSVVRPASQKRLCWFANQPNQTLNKIKRLLQTFHLDVPLVTVCHSL